jgi:hypothetical protein
MGKGGGYKGGWKAFGELIAHESICGWLVNAGLTRIGIDAFCWLHRIAAMHSIDLVIHRNFDNIVRDFLVQAVAVQQTGVSQLFVFDSDDMPGKQVTGDRRERRAEALLRSQVNIPIGLDVSLELLPLMIVTHIPPISGTCTNRREISAHHVSSEEDRTREVDTYREMYRL